MAKAKASTTPSDAASDPDGPTGKLSAWLAEAELSTIPAAVRERAKYLLLDGIGCLLVGTHIDWSALGVDAITGFDQGGSNMIVGWGEKRTNAYSAAMLNSSFIQAFELDDYYPAAPVHSNSILIPAMLPVIENRPGIGGADVLLALILGYETGTRVGLALHGPQMLSRGWHSGVVFGGAAAAASVGKLLGLSAAGFEDAIGMASTQACGLMSAQFESMIKRMQHGFAARNGLYAAVLAQGGYVGIKRVFECEYGGFLGVFGEGHDPDVSQISAGLGSRWITTEIAIKPYSAMAGLHGAIDCCLKIREDGVGADQVKTILVEVGGAAFQHGGFEIKRPIQPITAQMSLRYSVAVALLDGGALAPQFSNKRINQDDVWSLLDRVDVRHEGSFDKPPHSPYTTRVTVMGTDGAEHKLIREAPHGGEGNLLTNAEIVEKFESLTSDLMEAGRSHGIRDFVLGLDTEESLDTLLDLLKAPVKNALA